MTLAHSRTRTEMDPAFMQGAQAMSQLVDGLEWLERDGHILNYDSPVLEGTFFRVQVYMPAATFLNDEARDFLYGRIEALEQSGFHFMTVLRQGRSDANNG